MTDGPIAANQTRLTVPTAIHVVELRHTTRLVVKAIGSR